MPINQLIHVVHTCNQQGLARLYIGGTQVAEKSLGGGFGNWDETFRLALAGETNQSAPWTGELHLVAIYGQALNENEVRQNLEDVLQHLDEPGANNDSRCSHSFDPRIYLLWCGRLCHQTRELALAHLPSFEFPRNTIFVQESVYWSHYYGKAGIDAHTKQ